MNLKILLVLHLIIKQCSGKIGGIEFEQVFDDGNVTHVHPSPINAAARDLSHPHDISDEIRKSPRIIGGRKARKGEAPYLILIQIPSSRQWCGGAIYNHNTIITAAHCFFAKGQRIPVNQFKFIAGELDLDKLDRTEMERKGASVLVHPNYTPSDFINDIAILKTQTSFRYTYTVQPIPIAKARRASTGELIIGGFGYTRPRRSNRDVIQRSEFPTILQMASVKLVSDADCEEVFEASEQILTVIKHNSLFCAGGEKREPSTDACQGDSGGPGVCSDENKNKYLCGIVATGVGCGNSGIPGIYTNVSFFNSWILDNAGSPDPPTRHY